MDVKYLPRTAIKGQILADFVAEFTPATEQKDLNKTTLQEIRLKTWAGGKYTWMGLPTPRDQEPGLS